MKSFLGISFLSFFTLQNVSLAQNYMADVFPAYGKPLTINSIQKPDNLDDIIPYYPHSWIDDYKNVEITVTRGEQLLSANGNDANLNDKQQELLNSLFVGDRLSITTNYSTVNGITGEKTVSKMEVKYLIVPEFQATYEEDEKALRKHFYSLVVDPLNEQELIFDVSVQFIIDEGGSVKDVQLKNSSGNKSTDELILNSVSKMHKWNPSHNADGKKFKQEFVLRVFNGGC